MKAQIYNLIILDRSGSMETIKKEAIDGYNETLGTIKAAQLKYLDTQEHFISLAAFCGCGVDLIFDKVSAKDAEKLTADKYDPCCSTPLYDAIGSTCKQLKKHIKDDPNANVVVTIITDGCENSSQEWSGKAVKELIENLKEEGWMFSFIGSEYNAKELAMQISITNTIQWTKTSEGTEAMFENENCARSRHYDRLNDLNKPGAAPMSDEELRENKKKLSRNYFNKEVK